MPDFPPLTLVTGGIASGKSAWAETLAAASGKNRVYIATAQAHDTEMQAKIARHRAERGTGWRTIEAPRDLIAPLSGPWRDDVILIDCLTMWLTNQLMAGADLAQQSTRLLDCLSTVSAPVILVTNEVGSGGVSPNALARRFAAAQGRLNRDVARRADLVVALISGLPLALKGAIPKAAR